MSLSFCCNIQAGSDVRQDPSCLTSPVQAASGVGEIFLVHFVNGHPSVNTVDPSEDGKTGTEEAPRQFYNHLKPTLK